MLAEYYNYAGVQHFELGQLDEALKHYNLAVTCDHSNGTWLFNRGLCKFRLDQIEEAIEDFTMSINSGSDNKEQNYN